MKPDDLIKFTVNNGLAVIIIGFLSFMSYRYFEMRMEQMSYEFHQRLNTVGYVLKGEVTDSSLERPREVLLDLQLTEIRLKPSQKDFEE